MPGLFDDCLTDDQVRHRRRKILWLLFGPTLVVLLWLLWPYPFGMLAASIDNARGHYEVQSWGLPSPWSRECGALLWGRYRVELNTVGGCMISAWQGSYSHGYNSVSEALLKRKYGKDVFQECFHLAAQQYRMAHPKEYKDK